MRCYICSKDDSSVVYDTLFMQYSCCAVCQESVDEILDEYEEEDVEDDYSTLLER